MARARDSAAGGPAARALPSPLTHQLIDQALAELQPSQRRSIEKCLNCFSENRMGKEELLGFVRSMATYSSTIREMFRKSDRQDARSVEVASQEEMAELTLLCSGMQLDGMSSGEWARPPKDGLSVRSEEVAIEHKKSKRARGVNSTPGMPMAI